MKVKELIELLKKFDPELPVYTSAEYELPVVEENIMVEKLLEDDTKALVIGA